MNSIDPRVMKELLQLQMLNKMALISGDSSTSAADDSSDFGALLETIMGQAPGAQAMQPLSAWAGNQAGAMNGVPASLSALAKSYYPPRISESGHVSQSQFDELIQEASSRYGVDPALVKGVIQQESAFNHRAVSSAGAKGLMQLMDGTGSEYGVTNAFDPRQNVDAGTRFLRDLLNKYKGNEGVALAAYNAGPGRVDRVGIRSDLDLADKLHLLPMETQAYVGKVLGYKKSYSQ